MYIDTIVIRFEGKNANGDWVPVKMTRVRTVVDGSPYVLTDFPISYDFKSKYERNIRKYLTKGEILSKAKEVLASEDGKGFVLNLHFDFSAFTEIRLFELPRSDFERSVIEVENQPARKPLEMESLLEHGE